MTNQKLNISNIGFKVSNNASNETEILIYDQIGAYFDWTTWEQGGVTYNNFEQQLNEALNQGNKINIRINSAGGDVHSGIAIYNLINRNADKNIHVYIDSIAYSMAAVIVHAVPKENRHMAANAMMMIHSASGTIYGQYNGMQLRELADTMDKYDDILATSIANESSTTKEEILAKYFNGKDHYFTAEEAQEAGFVSDITAKPAEAKTEENTLENLIKNIQSQIKAISNKLIHNPQNTKPMINLNDVIAKLRTGEISNEEATTLADTVEQFNEEKTTADDVSTAVAEATAPLQSENEALKTEIENLKNELRDKAIQSSGAAPDGAKDNTVIEQPKNFQFRPIPFHS